MRKRTKGASRDLAAGISPSNADRARCGESAVVGFAKASGTDDDLATDSETVLADLLADLMHWCGAGGDRDDVVGPPDFESALRRARDHYNSERNWPRA